MIPLYKPFLSKAERSNLLKAFESTWISSQGSFIKKFENDLKLFLDAKYINLVSNGTCALHLALLALNIKKGDEVLIPNYSYVAAANAIALVGAKPVFVDSNSYDWQMNLDDLENKITNKTRLILLVHLYGNSENLYKIKQIKQKYNLLLIEDCAEAIGTYYKNKHVGYLGDISTFSFFGNKTITTGEGGAVITKSFKHHNIISKLKNQGRSGKEKLNYYHSVLGFNYRMTNLAAAIGCSQLKKIQIILQKKNKIYELYYKNLKNILAFQNTHKSVIHSHWLVCVKCKNNKIRSQLEVFLSDNGIQTRQGFISMSMLPMYKSKKSKNSVSNLLSKTVLCLPSYPDLTTKEIYYICNKIKEFFS